MDTRPMDEEQAGRAIARWRRGSDSLVRYRRCGCAVMPGSPGALDLLLRQSNPVRRLQSRFVYVAATVAAMLQQSPAIVNSRNHHQSSGQVGIEVRGRRIRQPRDPWGARPDATIHRLRFLQPQRSLRHIASTSV